MNAEKIASPDAQTTIRLSVLDAAGEQSLGTTSKVVKSFCTTREAAQMLGVSVRTAQLWAEGGLLQAWKTDGGHRRISRLSIERLISVQRHSPPPRSEDAPDRLTIVVVDFQLEALQRYDQHLAAWPSRPMVFTARYGFEALVRLGMTIPDLLVTVLDLPDVDCLQMIEALRMMHELAGMSIVVAANADSITSEKLQRLPTGVLVLPRPIPFDRLQDIALVVLDRKQRTVTADVG